MLKVAKKHNAGFIALSLSNNQKRLMPIWYHIGIDPKLKVLYKT